MKWCPSHAFTLSLCCYAHFLVLFLLCETTTATAVSRRDRTLRLPLNVTIAVPASAAAFVRELETRLTQLLPVYYLRTATSHHRQPRSTLTSLEEDLDGSGFAWQAASSSSGGSSGGLGAGVNGGWEAEAEAEAEAEGGRDDRVVSVFMQYQVVVLSRDWETAYLRFVAAQPKDVAGVHVIAADRLGQFLRQREEEAVGSAGSAGVAGGKSAASLAAIPFLLMDGLGLPHRIVPHLNSSVADGAIEAADASTVCTQSYLDRVAFYDFSAQPCWTPVVAGASSSSSLGGGAATAATAAAWTAFNAQRMGIEPGLAQYAAAVIAGVKSLVYLSREPAALGLSLARTLYVPIIVLQNGRIVPPAATATNSTVSSSASASASASGAAAAASASTTVDLIKVRRFLSSILPNSQEISLMTSTYHVDDHPALAVALAQAMLHRQQCTHSAHDACVRQPYLDSSILHNVLSAPGSVTDIFLHQLLDKAGSSDYIKYVINSHFHAFESLKPKLDTLSKAAKASNQAGVSKPSQLDRLVLPLKAQSSASAPSSETASNSNSAPFETRSWEKAASVDQNIMTAVKRYRQLGRLGRLAIFQKDIAILPVFVFSDMHVHAARLNGEDGAGIGEGEARPVQPLFDLPGQLYASVTSDLEDTSIYVLHAQDPDVHVAVLETEDSNSKADSWAVELEVEGRREPESREKRRTLKLRPQPRLLDAESLIAEALAKTLSGLSTVHERHGLDDLTWGLGNHPFYPFGSLHQVYGGSGEDSFDLESSYLGGHYEKDASLITLSIQRSLALSQAALIKASHQELIQEVVGLVWALADKLYLLDENARRRIQVPHALDSQEISALIQTLNATQRLPDLLLKQLLRLQEQESNLSEAFDLLAEQALRFNRGSMERFQSLLRLDTLDRSFEYQSLETIAQLHEAIARCQVTFIDKRKLPEGLRIAGVDSIIETEASRPFSTARIIRAIFFVGLLTLMAIILWFQRRIELRAKKLK